MDGGEDENETDYVNGDGGNVAWEWLFDQITYKGIHACFSVEGVSLGGDGK